MSVAPPGGQDRIMIYGPKDDGTYIVEFRTAAGEALAISIPRTECAVIRHFQERMTVIRNLKTAGHQRANRRQCPGTPTSLGIFFGGPPDPSRDLR